jgi:hypothetical protein
MLVGQTPGTRFGPYEAADRRPPPGRRVWFRTEGKNKTAQLAFANRAAPSYFVLLTYL